MYKTLFGKSGHICYVFKFSTCNCILNYVCAGHRFFLEITLAHVLVCVSVCPPSRVLVTSGIISWCDIDHV